MNRNLIFVFLFTLLVMSGLSYATTIQFTLTNPSTPSTSSGFQQMIFFNPSAYPFSGILSSDNGNIRFYAGMTELNAWCESGCTNASSNTILWVNLSSSVVSGSGGTIVINMTPASQGTEYDGVYMGESPTQSPYYAEFDNGNRVFSYYTNFVGTSLPSGWNSGGTIAVSNGITVSGGGWALDSGGTSYSQGLMDFYGNKVANLVNAWIGEGFMNTADFWNGGSAHGNTWSSQSGENSGEPTVASNDGSNAPYTVFATPSGTSGLNVFSLAFNVSANTNLGFENYGAFTSTISQLSRGALYLGISNVQSGASSTEGPIYWMRTRILPPSMAMPLFNYSEYMPPTTTSTSTTTSTTSTSTSTTTATTTISTTTSTSVTTTTSTSTTSASTTSSSTSVYTVTTTIPNGYEGIVGGCFTSVFSIFLCPFNIVPEFGLILIFVAFGIGYTVTKTHKLTSSFLGAFVISAMISLLMVTAHASTSTLALYALCSVITAMGLVLCSVFEHE